MNAPFHSFTELFDQLGLASDEAAIQSFIADHAPLPSDMRLPAAPFWTPAQRRLLHESLAADSDWAEVVDRLSLALRAG